MTLKGDLIDAKSALKRSIREAEGSKHELKMLQGQLKQLAKGKVAQLSQQLVEMHGADQRLQRVAAELVERVATLEEEAEALETKAAGLEEQIAAQVILFYVATCRDVPACSLKWCLNL